MSLLLEALKKAELAKQGTTPDPEPVQEEPAPFPTVDLTLEERIEEPRTPVITRESLPDITQPLDITTEDLGTTRREAPRVQPVVAPQPAPQPKLEPAPPPPIAEPAREPHGFAAVPDETDSAARDAARQMFDVKEVDYNPRRPFYFTVGGLVLAGACYAGYVWWQMQPHYSVNTAAVQNAPAKPAAAPAAAAPAPAADAPAAETPAPAPAAVDATPPARTRPAASTAAAEPQAVAPARRNGGTAKGARETEVEPRAASAPLFVPTNAAAASAVRRSSEPGTISITPASATTDPALDRAYGAYQAGRLEEARNEYVRVLERDPSNRDALLGLAAMDIRAGNFETAELRYLKLLEINPRDTYAVGALVGLQGNVDPVQSESRIKSLMATQPDATHLYFTLGNLYAAQSRWSEAQDAYFRAYSADPDNADYAFNLAVSLDRLRQRRPALDYYRKALSLAQTRPAAFERERVQRRVAELER